MPGNPLSAEAPPVLSHNYRGITGRDACLKTILEYTLLAIGFLPALLVMALLAVLVRISSPGPILHRRQVLGRGGIPFYAYKFRTMVVNADQVLAEILAREPSLAAEYRANRKLKNDPRVTPIGHFLRRTSLDELPQIFNVLKGEMSLIGPRMIAPDEAEYYGPWQADLLTVKPGMTGPWQVRGRNNLPYSERVRLTMDYIHNYSLWLDIKILADTIRVVLKGEGAF